MVSDMSSISPSPPFKVAPGSSNRRGHRALNAEVEVQVLVPELMGE